MKQNRLTAAMLSAGFLFLSFYLEVHTHIEEEVAVAYSVKVALADIGNTKVNTDFSVQHLIFYATANAQTCIKAVAVVAKGAFRGTLVDVASVGLCLAANTQCKITT